MTAAACWRTVSNMAYDRYPARERAPTSRSASASAGLPDRASATTAASRRAARASTATSRTARSWASAPGSPTIPGFDVALVRICFLAAVFMSGGSVLPFYFIAGWVAPTKPRELEYRRCRGPAVLAGRPRFAGARRARHPLAVQGHRPAPRRHRKLRDDREPLARARDRAASLSHQERGKIRGSGI